MAEVAGSALLSASFPMRHRGGTQSRHPGNQAGRNRLRSCCKGVLFGWESGLSFRPCRTLRCSRGSLPPRQLNPEGAPPPGSGLHLYRAAMLPDNLLGNGKAQSRTPGALTAEERLEDGRKVAPSIPQPASATSMRTSSGGGEAGKNIHGGVLVFTGIQGVRDQVQHAAVDALGATSTLRAAAFSPLSFEQAANRLEEFPHPHGQWFGERSPGAAGEAFALDRLAAPGRNDEEGHARLVAETLVTVPDAAVETGQVHWGCQESS